MTFRYDPSTAITFLMIGLGVGALTALLLSPRIPSRPQAKAPPRFPPRAAARAV